MKPIIPALGIALLLGGCAAQMQQLKNLEGTFVTLTTATARPSDVNIAINAYEGLKITADGYKDYCIQNKFPRPQCSAANRRKVIQFVNAGDGAAAVLTTNLNSGQPLLSTTYNALVGAINGLKTAPISVRS